MLSLVPLRIKIRVTLPLFLGTALLAGIFFLPLLLNARLLMAALTLVAGAYILWCFWPRFSFGVRTEALPPAAPSLNFSLSFDDGPSPSLTEEILDLLERHRLKASFFILVHKAEAHPELVRKISRAGHTVGLHGYDHRKPFFKSARTLRRTLGDAKIRLERITGLPVELFRPSHGWKNIALIHAVNRLGMRFCYWDYGVWDTANPSASELQTRIAHAMALSAQSERCRTILLHDGLGDQKGCPKHGTVLVDSLGGALQLSRGAE